MMFMDIISSMRSALSAVCLGLIFIWELVMTYVTSRCEYCTIEGRTSWGTFSSDGLLVVEMDNQHWNEYKHVDVDFH